MEWNDKWSLPWGILGWQLCSVVLWQPSQISNTMVIILFHKKSGKGMKANHKLLHLFLDSLIHGSQSSCHTQTPGSKHKCVVFLNLWWRMHELRYGQRMNSGSLRLWYSFFGYSIQSCRIFKIEYTTVYKI